MEVAYKELLAIELSHNYYADGKSDDFEFVFTEATRKLFSKGKLLPKYKNKRFSIYAETRSGVLSTDLSGKRLDIGMVLKNPNFYNFTNSPGTPGVQIIGNNGVNLLSAKAGRVVGQRFAHRISKEKRPVTLGLVIEGDTVEQHEIVADQKLDEFNFLLKTLSDGEFKLVETYADETLEHHYFRADELLGSSLDTLLSIELDNAFLANPPSFSLPFTARQETLSYYVVARNYNSEFNQLNVTGSDKLDIAAPVAINFNKVVASNFNNSHLSKDVLGIDADSKVVLFQSTSKISRREQPKMDIQLSLNNETLIPMLPLTGPERLTADFIVHLSKPKT